MKKILLLIDGLGTGGAQRQIVTLADRLVMLGYNVKILTYRELPRAFHAPLAKEIEIFLIPKKYKYDIQFGWKLLRFLAFHRPDCIISYLSTPNFYARICGKFVGIERIITSERNIDLVHSKKKYMIERLTCSASDVIVVNTLAAADIYNRYFHRVIDRVEVIYNGLDVEVYKRTVDKDQLESIKFQLKIGRKDRIICLPGRIENQKNHIALLRAFCMLPPRIKQSLKLLFVGSVISSNIQNELLDFSQEMGIMGRVTFTGHRSDIKDIYSLSDVIVLPSLYEGFPNALIEAMSCEALVVASAVADNQVIIDDGIDGYLFRRGDDGELAEKLGIALDLTSIERSQIGVRARDKVARLCALETFDKRYRAVIEGDFTLES